LPPVWGGPYFEHREERVANLSTPRELFLHELGDILFVERKLVNEVLPSLIEEVESKKFRNGLSRHLKQTRAHVTKVEKVFKLLGEEPEAEKCLGFEGLKKEHEELSSEADHSLIDLVDAGAAARTEHYEIAAYSGLIEMARSLGEQKAVVLLGQNLREEKEALREVESVAKALRDDLKKAAVS
jgi:ferritin-like metal-binding protein YciE